MTTEVPLTRGMFALIDDQDMPIVFHHSWSVKPGKKTFYAIRRVLVREGRGRTHEFMHRLLTGWSYVDHINGGWAR